MAEAMAERLPVVAFADSDGGNKLGDQAVEDSEDYFDKLQSLIVDRSLREQTGAAMHALFSRTHDLEQSGPSLLAAISRWKGTGNVPRSSKLMTSCFEAA